MCEQVSHHPPVSAFYGEGEHYTIHGSIQPKMKFWGKSIEVTPKGMITLNLKKSVNINLKSSNVLIMTIHLKVLVRVILLHKCTNISLK